MHKWTDDAKLELENYLQKVAQLSNDQGDDSQEIVEGLRDHVTREAENTTEPFITAARVRSILAQLGSAEEVVGIETNDPNIASSNTTASNGQNPGKVTAQLALELERSHLEKAAKRRGAWEIALSATFHVFTICVALAAILIAAGMPKGDSDLAPPRFGSELMPTLMHFWGLLMVPAGILYNFIVLRFRPQEIPLIESNATKPKDRSGLIRLSLIFTGYVATVSFYYMVMFIPLLPFALIAAIFLIGLLPLAPYFTFIISCSHLYQFGRWAKTVQVTRRWILLGIAIAFTMYGGWIIHHSACCRAIQLATSSNPEGREKGIRWLKTLHGEKKVLQGCYGHLPGASPFIGMFRPTFFSPQEFQTLYYRMTGLDYRSAPYPAAARMARSEERWDDWTLESEIGGDVVGIRVPGLSLNSSMIDAVVAGDPKAQNAGPCVAYVQWVLEFKNDSSQQREARCQIQMPPDSVGSRLTLWINGVEEEAAFGKRTAVKKAYKDVAVRQRRDPALLTSDGANRLLLQCFPIEPNSTMKVKVGMSIPLMIRNGKTSKTKDLEPEAILQLPYLADRNFSIGPDFKHEVWAECSVPMRSQILEVEHPQDSLFNARGQLTEADLKDSTKALLRLDAPRPSEALYTAELNGFSGTDILVDNKPFESDDKQASRTVAMVVDTSRVCKDVKEFDWNSFFESAPEGIQFSLFVGTHSKENLSAKQAAKTIKEFLDQSPFDAADEQTENLEKAWDLCAKSKHGLVLWIHGPMPVELSSYAGLTQRMTRRPGHIDNDNPRIASVQIMPGPNLIEQNLAVVSGMFRMPVFSSVEWTLNDIARNLNRPGLVPFRLTFDFYAGPLTQDEILQAKPSTTSTAKSSDQIVRIALGQRVYVKSQAILKAAVKEQLAEEAAKLRLVTPLTGAVVLERKEQYAQHGLDPTINPEATANIPEPETWVLMISIFVAFIVMVWRQRQQRHVLGKA